jgi:septal ring factor EnvC (AmiA/AmiB activator)
MAIFGSNSELEDLKSRHEKLKKTVRDFDVDRKKLAAALAAEQQRSAQLTAEIDLMKGEVGKAITAVRKARQRQKNSVERANRFKEKVG